MLIDHLFRHQYGKMVSILTHIFGLSNMDLVEDALQETFAKATLTWREKVPENPEAWFTQVAKNKTIDLLRSQIASKKRDNIFINGSSVHQIEEFFQEKEAEDSQLKMIFVACHPELKVQDQITFALKTISGFNLKEIASALLTSHENIKKRILRARATIQEKNIPFEFPNSHNLQERLDVVLKVIYLTFNEGFHSASSSQIIREDLCGEAVRLCKIILKNPELRSGPVYSLFSLLCFHSARLRTKVGVENEVIGLEHQDRSKWYKPLIDMGQKALTKAHQYPRPSSYLYEAEIAAEHLKAVSFADTNWQKILTWYEKLYEYTPSPFVAINVALVFLNLNKLEECKNRLDEVVPSSLGRREYLFYGCYAEYYIKIGDKANALLFLDKTLEHTVNPLEKDFILQKRNRFV